MTCFEKYKQDHGGKEPNVNQICPNTSGGIDIGDPDYCTFDNENGGCTRCWNREAPVTDPLPATKEAVNHPKHYGRKGAIECIDEMVLVFGVKATMNFCLLNAWKYRYRAADKNGAEDIEKSDWYMAKYAELKGGD